MTKREKLTRAERRAVKKDEKALSGNTYGCDACSHRFGTVEMLGLHKVVAHGQ